MLKLQILVVTKTNYERCSCVYRSFLLCLSEPQNSRNSND